PISIVKSYAELLKRRGKERTEVFDEAVEAIDSEADRMQLLVEQMLLLAKNQVETESTSIDVLELCNAGRRQVSGAYKREIKVITSDDSIIIYGNEDQLKQVIYKLLDNALKYSDQEIILNIFKQNEQAIIDVTDFGSGIASKDLERIFDRFYRVD